jgi:hypothetical protein
MAQGTLVPVVVVPERVSCRMIGISLLKPLRHAATGCTDGEPISPRPAEQLDTVGQTFAYHPAVDQVVRTVAQAEAVED